MAASEFFYECDRCRRKFSAMLYEITRQLERVSYNSKMPQIYTSESNALSEYCPRECRDLSRRAVMKCAGVPIWRVDGVGPVLPCAKCGWPVDVTEVHVIYAEIDFEVICESMLQPIGFAYLAVLCSKCESINSH